MKRIRIIWALLEGQRGRYAAAIVALVLTSVFLYLAPIIVQVTLDGVLLPDDAGDSRLVSWGLGVLGGREFVAARLWWPGLLVVAVTIVAGVFTYLRGRWAAQASEAIALRVRDDLYDHLQHLPCRWYDDAQTGDVIQRCTSDVETLRVFLSTQVVEIGRAAIMLLMPLPIMLMIDVRMTLVSLVMLPPIFGFSVYYFRKVRAVFKSADEAEGRMTTTIQENLTGIRVVRAFARQSFEEEKFEGFNETHRKANLKLFELAARFWSTSDLLCFGQKCLVLGAGVWWLYRGELSVGSFYFFLTAVSMFVWPVRMMGRILTELGKALVAIDRVREVLDAPREADPDPSVAQPDIPERLGGAIEFDHVVFRHGEATVLDDVSFAIPAGGTLALVGPSGCGKSTIVDLLLRLYDIDSGSIRIDGIPINAFPRKALRAQTAVVMQEPFLYSKSLRENLVIGRPSAEEAEMLTATQVASVHEAILDFDDGYDTSVGERGVTLSGGQRQRVALARALLQDPAILMLDDSLSAVDARTESSILESLRVRQGNRTSILISHRLATVMHADFIVVLEDGRVTQVGTHDRLTRQPGLYQRLWAHQTLADESSMSNERSTGKEARDV